jgi:transcriptional regulator with XRE-family HTH domain
MMLALAVSQGIGPEVAELAKRKRGQRSPSLRVLLSAHRIRTGMLLSDVQKRSNLARSTLNDLEEGHKTSAGIRTLQAISYGYRLPFVRVLMAALKDM